MVDMRKEDDNVLSNAAEQSQEIEKILNEFDDDKINSDGTVTEEEVTVPEENDNKENILDDSELLGNDEKEYNSSIRKKLFIGIGSLVAVVVIALAVVFTDKGKDINKAEVVLKPNAGFELTADIESIVKVIRNSLDNLYNSNAYITLHIGEGESDVVFLLYNKDKECYMESGFSNSIAVFRTDGKAVVLTNPVEVVEDIHLLKLMERMLELVENGYAEAVIDNTVPETEVQATTYNLIVSGKHNIRKLYTVISENYANERMDSIFGDDYDASKYTAGYVDESDEDSLTLQVVVGNNNEFGATAFVNIGGFKQHIWWFDGYMELDSYELEEKWYGVDNDTGTWVELATNLQKTLSDNIGNYLEENLTEDEKTVLEESSNSNTGNIVDNNDLPVGEFTRPDGELTSEEEAWWDYIESIQLKLENGEELTEQEKSDYYSMPPSGELEIDVEE